MKRLQKTITETLNEARSFPHFAHLIPHVRRLVVLQQECEKQFPQIFQYCRIINLENGLLIIAAPNNALASKCKQNTPSVFQYLVEKGWQISSIKLKVQANIIETKPNIQKTAQFSEKAFTAFEQLQSHLENSPNNQGLKEAIQRILQQQTKSH